ncbi:RNA polymerase sigma-70 factor, ECF subfamily [Gracilibacillus ureilyticus]|uniref:RNA polymerase sigma-70 factor, ECF subfamily n=1 Tax=Gracilibacillus ureilyticus TaxID=531814 RepID=A0A1H9VPX3_9BACI|nr:RNA polymerase sigma factor [Gracilibacillus ureilyticus]SES23642.1 RNA polymerase sigma-70 factor, ECF subfamily [Gracilibacillus ureilyticus]
MNSSKLEELFNSYHRQIYQFTYRYTQDETLSAEITQDTFIKFHNYKESFDPAKSHIRTFLFRIAYQLTMTKLKRRNKFKKLLPFLYERHNVSSISLDDKISIRTALMELPQSHRSVIILFYYHALSHNEISDILQIPIGTVKSRLYHSLKKLKHLLEVEDDE